MTQYEITFIVNPQTDDATINAQVKAITDIITNASGKIVYENLMGTRRMAYPIKKLSQGYYANFIFDAPKTVVAEIDLHIRMNEAYLRHLTIVYEGPIPDPNAPPPEEYRGFGRPRGGYGDRPYGRRDGGRDGYRDRGRPEPATRRPEGDGPPKDAPAASTAPATDKPAADTAPTKPATDKPAADTAPAKPATDKPAPDTAPAKPETAATPETAPAAPAPAAPAPPAPKPEPVKAVEPKPTPKPAAAEPKPETPTPAPPVTPPEPTKAEEYREDEEL